MQEGHRERANTFPRSTEMAQELSLKKIPQAIRGLSDDFAERADLELLGFPQYTYGQFLEFGLEELMRYHMERRSDRTTFESHGVAIQDVNRMGQAIRRLADRKLTTRDIDAIDAIREKGLASIVAFTNYLGGLTEGPAFFARKARETNYELNETQSEWVMMQQRPGLAAQDIHHNLETLADTLGKEIADHNRSVQRD